MNIQEITEPLPTASVEEEENSEYYYDDSSDFPSGN